MEWRFCLAICAKKYSRPAAGREYRFKQSPARLALAQRLAAHGEVTQSQKAQAEHRGGRGLGDLGDGQVQIARTARHAVEAEDIDIVHAGGQDRTVVEGKRLRPIPRDGAIIQIAEQEEDVRQRAVAANGRAQIVG